MKTLLWACFLLAVPVAVSADASTLQRLAGCAGRLSAQVEHEWLMRDPRSDRTQAERDEMAGLAELATDPSQAVRARTTRINAKAAQAKLLSRATFNADKRDARWASRRAAAELAACRAVLLTLHPNS